ncbi:hypothetical protein [Streptomyces silvisoli]|uniref:Uncharacterized protein n=1 Tax=Streptomyces silvisoli TaxID=3034235 RepID=A0ABT5ZTN3_9ACTN|nr:hypothetical protein [Streptomyces silvisoli]MDF3293190.1 hypothetical protein [Streptomyces silvisoli]
MASDRLYTLMRNGVPEIEFVAARDAVIGMAKAIRVLRMTADERRSWRGWYTWCNYRAAVLSLHRGDEFVFGVRSNGKHVTFRITPPTDRKRVVRSRYSQHHCDRCHDLMDLAALSRRRRVLVDELGDAERVTDVVCTDGSACEARRRQKARVAASGKAQWAVARR